MSTSLINIIINYITSYIDIIINARKRGMKKVDPDGEGGLAAVRLLVFFRSSQNMFYNSFRRRTWRC